MDTSQEAAGPSARLAKYMLDHPASPYRVFGSSGASAAALADAELIVALVEALEDGAPVDLARRRLGFLIESLRSRGLSADLMMDLTQVAEQELGLAENVELVDVVRSLMTQSRLETWQPGELDTNPSDAAVEMFEAVKTGNLDWARLVATVARDNGVSVDAVLETLIRPAMYLIGHGWSQGTVSVEEEHLATTTSAILTVELLTESDIPIENHRTAIVAMVPTNVHELGPQLIADALTRAGWNVTLLPPGTSAEDLVAAVAEDLPDLLCLSIALPQSIPSLRQTVDVIAARLGSEMPRIIVGGLAAVSYPEYIADSVDAAVCSGGIPDLLELVADFFPDRRAP